MNPESRPSVPPQAAHVIVVEDDVSNYATVQRLLIYAGVAPENCEWITSGLGVEQFAEARQTAIDLILMDLRLPHEDGYEVLKQLRANPQLASTRIVAVTGYASVEEMRRAQQAGFDGFLSKPLRKADFPEQLRRILRHEPVWDVQL